MIGLPHSVSSPTPKRYYMAFKSAATLIRGATVAAIFIVVVLTSSMGKMAAADTSCTQSSCMSKCPSTCQEKAEGSCRDLEHGGSPQCPYNCLMGCKRSCESACNSGLGCPSGGVQACEPECRPQCDKNCYDKEKPDYRPCLKLVSERCQNECEAACKGGN